MVNLTAPLRSDSPLEESNHQYSEDTATRVLLLLDVQKGMLDPESPVKVPAAEKVKANIEEILQHARNAPQPPLIIHTRNTGDAGEPDEPGEPGWPLVFDPLPGEIVIDKLKNNAFAGTSLGEMINPDAEIVVAGMQSDFCIRDTCSAALRRGNFVLLIRDAHATHDRLEVWGNGVTTPAMLVEKEIEQELSEAHTASPDMSGILHILDMSHVKSIWEEDR